MKTIVSLLFAACCLTVVFAGDDEQCSAVDRLKIKSQWAKLYGPGEARRSLGVVLWKTIFNIEPKIKDAVTTRLNSNNLYSPIFQAFIARSLGVLDVLVTLLDDADTLKAQVTFLSADMKSRNVPPVYFKVLAQAFQEVAPAQLGRCYDSEAWRGCWEQLIKDTQIPSLEAPPS